MTGRFADCFCAAVLKEACDFFWAGFYRVVGNELVLGPFQGPLTYTQIRNRCARQPWRRNHRRT